MWVAIEDADTCEISDFEYASEKDVLYLLDGYKVDMTHPTKFRVRDEHVIYDGVIYKGGFGYNLWVASKYVGV